MRRLLTVALISMLSLLLQLNTSPADQEGSTTTPARLFLTSDPPEGYLTLDGKLMGRLPLWSEDITPGFHDVRVSKEGFTHWFQKMYFAPGREYWLTAHLVKEAQMNRLAISSIPDGADVFIDEEYRGITPLTIYYIPVGEHAVFLRSDTLSWREQVSVPAADTMTIAATLEKGEFRNEYVGVAGSSHVAGEGEVSAAASCFIEEKEGIPSSKMFLDSDPPGAYLTLDRKRVGKLPRSIEDLRPGFHDIRVSLDGFDHWYQRMCVAPDNEYWITAHMEKGAEMNRLEIVSIPNGAQVFVDSKYRGNTPLSIFLLPPGQHEITLLQDTLSWHEVVSVKKRESRMIEGELSRLEGTVSVKSPLDSLKIEVDGVAAGFAPAEISVPLGRRQFRFSRGLTHESTRDYFIKPDKVLEIDVERILNKAALEERDASYRSKRKRHLYTGLLSAGGSVLFYVLQRRAYDKYMDSTTSSEIDKNFDSARRNQIISLSIAGFSAYSFIRYIIIRKPSVEEYELISETDY